MHPAEDSYRTGAHIRFIQPYLRVGSTQGPKEVKAGNYSIYIMQINLVEVVSCYTASSDSAGLTSRIARTAPQGMNSGLPSATFLTTTPYAPICSK